MMRNNRVPIIGVTGNTGCGKTTVCGILGRHGGYVIDADILAHEAILPGQAAYDEIVGFFGQPVLDSRLNATGLPFIDRAKLGRVVFNDRSLLAKLEQIIHPRVSERIHKLIDLNPVCAFFAIDAPLLIEAGLHEQCDSVWLIISTGELMAKRIIARDNLSGDDVKWRMKNKRDEEWLAEYADVVIHNDGNLETLRDKVLSALAGRKGVVIQGGSNG